MALRVTPVIRYPSKAGQAVMHELLKLRFTWKIMYPKKKKSPLPRPYSKLDR